MCVYVCMYVCVYVCIYILYAHTHMSVCCWKQHEGEQRERRATERGHPLLFLTVKELETAVKELETKVSELSLAQDRVERLRRYTSDGSVVTKQPTAKR